MSNVKSTIEMNIPVGWKTKKRHNQTQQWNETIGAGQNKYKVYSKIKYFWQLPI